MSQLAADTYIENEIPIIQSTAAEPVFDWMALNLDALKDVLSNHGGVLLRGYGVTTEDAAEATLRGLGGDLLDDAYWSTPRSGVAKKTFTATDYPKENTIALHSEMAYMSSGPRLLTFHSIKAADQGGETTICNIDKLSQSIASLLPDFRESGVLYKRIYRPGVDIPWQKAFQTDDKKQVQKIGDKMGMDVKWLDNDTLQTTHKAQGCIKSEQNADLWFNQSHIFHAANLPEETRATLIEMFGEDGLPRTAYYGSGKPIPDNIIHDINSALVEHTIKVPWQSGDILIIDNMRYLHGRAPFEGTRKLHVAMADGCTHTDRCTLFGEHYSTTLSGKKQGFLQKLKQKFL